MTTQSYTLQDAIELLTRSCSNLEQFILPSEELIDDFTKQVKQLYDFTKEEEGKNTLRNALPELITQGFDLEQVWQQLELQNGDILDSSVSEVSKVLTQSDELIFKELERYGIDEDEEKEKNDTLNEEVVDEDNKEIESDLDYNNDSFSSDEETEKQKPKKKGKSSVVDDEFFKLQEMENFLNQEESKLNKSEKDDTDSKDSSDSEGSIDLFGGNDDDDEEEIGNPKYKEFFGQNTKTKNMHGEEEPKSSLQLREERLKRRIENVERQAVGEKPWQMKGEIAADNRPLNSLLEEVVEFDLTTRPAPIITEEVSLYLEDIIRQRIKDKVFDSVVRKERPIETPLEYKKKLVLDQEKSKESLAQIYEREYLEQEEALDPNATDKEEVEPELHKEVKKLMSSLFAKLDALSNFHFTPKPAVPELKIVTNLPAISMEEVAPIAVSDAALLAPEEVKRKPKGDLIGKAERTDTDKKRERRKKKLKQKIHATAKQKREQSKIGLGNKYSKDKMKKAITDALKDKNVDKMDESFGSKNVKSSTAFFTQLQDQVQSHIASQTQAKRKKQKQQFEAKRLKL